MEDSIEYQIYIGFNDSQVLEEIVSGDELLERVSRYFESNKVSFSMLNAHGGYLYSKGGFITENVLCITIIGGAEEEMVRIAKGLSMFMNQESALIVRTPLKKQYF